MKKKKEANQSGQLTCDIKRYIIQFLDVKVLIKYDSLSKFFSGDCEPYIQQRWKELTSGDEDDDDLVGKLPKGRVLGGSGFSLPPPVSTAP